MTFLLLKFCHRFDKLVMGFVDPSYDYRPNWTPLSTITVTPSYVSGLQLITIKFDVRKAEGLSETLLSTFHLPKDCMV